MRQSLKQVLPESVIRLYRLCRKYAYIFLEPFDYVARVINNKKDFPPLYLRRYVGPLRSFEMSGAEFMVYLRLICKLQSPERVLDIGCGCGLMALFLLDYLDRQGSYIGVDIHKPSIEWCQRHIGRRHIQFTFRHIDVKNQTYNPGGQYAAEDYSFPFENHVFDVILLKSVFTHMRPPGVDNYFKEIARLLSNNGRCLVTFFLLNEKQENLAKKGVNKLHFKFGNEIWRYAYKNSPETAIAYREDYIMDLLPKHGLVVVEPIFYGTWSGRKDGVSYQDMLLIQKR